MIRDFFKSCYGNMLIQLYVRNENNKFEKAENEIFDINYLEFYYENDIYEKKFLFFDEFIGMFFFDKNILYDKDIKNEINFIGRIIPFPSIYSDIEFIEIDENGKSLNEIIFLLEKDFDIIFSQFLKISKSDFVNYIFRNSKIKINELDENNDKNYSFTNYYFYYYVYLENILQKHQNNPYNSKLRIKPIMRKIRM